MQQLSSADGLHLAEHGLNLQAVFDLADLPPDIAVRFAGEFDDIDDYRQLILLAHGGRRLWQALMASAFADADDPVDNFSADLVRRWLDGRHRYRIIYPGTSHIVPLQRLGELAGWHHRSPFRVGVNHHWGSWFAYRAAVLADTTLPVSDVTHAPSPCDACSDRPCIGACPANALQDGIMQLECCIDYRLGESSPCRHQCLARLACPVGSDHRYTPEQIDYHYARSWQAIRAYRQPG